MKSIDLNTMKHVFRSSNDVEIPLLNERFNVLKVCIYYNKENF